MDTQDKLIVYIKGQETIFDLNNLPKKSILFSFFENNNVDFELQSEKYNIYVEVKENRCNCERDLMYLLSSGKKNKVFNDNNSLTPSIYTIIIENKNKKDDYIYKSFEVLPYEIIYNNNAYKLIIDMISSISPSFLYDISKSKFIKSLDNVSKYSLYQICDSLVKDEFLINNALTNCVNNPIVNLSKTIVSDPKYSKQNEKTIIKDIIKGNAVHSVKTKLDYNCIENSALYFYLNESCVQLISIEERIDNYLPIIEKNRLEKIKNINFADKENHKPKVARKLARLQEELDKINIMVDCFINTKRIISNFVYKINQIKYNSFLSGVRKNQVVLNEKFLNNISYSIIYKKLYLLLSQGRSQINANSENMKGLGYPYKSSSMLYEIYCFIIIIKLLENNGFIFDNTNSDPSIYNLEDIQENIIFTYVKDNITCQIKYNTQVINVFDEYKNELVFTDKKGHRTPDIQLLFTDENKNPVKLLVLDAKCRYYEYLKEDLDNRDPKLIATLKDYISYRYLKENQLFIEGKTIDELILLCVDDNLKEIEIDNRLGIKCCPLIPRLDYQNDIAYLELEKHIKAIFNSLENILIA